MISAKLYGPAKRRNSSSLKLRLIMLRNELFRLRPGSQSLTVVAGTAWVTVNGRDIFLSSGETRRLPAGRDTALISALGNAPLILEVFGAPPAPHDTALTGYFQDKNNGA